jgi:phosphonate transport system substrate-binding protein
MKKFPAAAVLASVALGIGLAACSSGGSSSSSSSPAANPGTSQASTPAASQAASQAAASACPSGSLSFGVEPYDDAAKLIPAYTAMAQALGHELHCTVNLTIADSYVAEILAMKNGKLDIAEFGPLGYVFADQEAGAIPVASFADKDGQPSSYTAGIWVKKGSPIKTVKDLVGHTLALSETGSTSGDALPRELLLQNGISKQVTVEYAGGHPQAELALANGKVDAAEINSQTVASLESSHQFDPSQYTQIWKSAPILNDPVTISPTLPASAQKTISDAILALTASQLTQVAGELDFTSPASGAAMVAVTKSSYRPLFDLAKALGLTTKNL